MSAWFEHRCFAMVYADDPTVYAGTATDVIRAFNSARMHNDDGPKVYVNSGGDIIPATVTEEAGDFDEFDYATVTVYVDGCEIGGYRIDGRA